MDQAPDSTEIDPSGHRIVLDNEHVRVLEVRNAPGEQLAMHHHPTRLVVAIGPYRLRTVDASGTESIIDRRSGEAIWVEGEEHEAEILVGPTHVIEVEVKSAR